MFIALLFVVALAVLSFGAVMPQDDTHGTNILAPLRFSGDGTFQISIFEDLHFGENAWENWGPQQDIWTTKVMNNILDVEPQQLVVLNGDLITGENTFLENSTEYIDQIVAPLVQRGISWASTYGNHDSQYNLSRESILGRERLYPNARTTQMVFNTDAGVTNYYLPVYSSDGGDEPCLILWFFDSRGGFYFQQLNSSGSQIGQPDWVDQSVVEWFVEANNELVRSYGRAIPSLAFVHIPTNASQALQTEAGVNAHYQPGINDDYPVAQQAQGWCPDGSDQPSCDYGGQDVPFMEAIASTPSLIALFSGHDHGNTWCYKWDKMLHGMTVEGNGVNLCFGQHSGYGGYGSWTRGSRQILVKESMLVNLEIDTWIRLETAEVVGAVTLNSTYNRDWYPATKNTHTHCPTCTNENITPPGPYRMLRRVVIKSDSAYLVKGMTDWIYGWRANGYINSRGSAVCNSDLFKQLEEAVDDLNDMDVQVQFWHVRRADNELADRLANAALNDESMGDALDEYFDD